MSVKRIWFAVQLLVTVALMALLFRAFQWAQFWEAIGRVPAWLYVGSFLVVLAGHALYACRWLLVLRAVGVGVRLARVVRVYFTSLFFGSFLPGTVGGDVARVYLLGRTKGYAQVGASVLVDRALALTALSIVGTILMGVVALPGEAFVVARRVLAVVSLACLGGVITAAWLPAPKRGAIDAETRSAVAWRERIRGLLGLVRQAVRTPATVLGVLFITLGYFTALAGVYQLFFSRFGIPAVGIGRILATVIVINVLSSIPVTVNGIGLREQLHFLFFAALGVPKEAAVSVSLILFGHTLAAALVGGVVWLVKRSGDAVVTIPANPTEAAANR